MRRMRGRSSIEQCKVLQKRRFVPSAIPFTTWQLTYAMYATMGLEGEIADITNSNTPVVRKGLCY